jgi:ABC-type branched-subunit amino acid transport system substrate-binding protein
MMHSRVLSQAKSIALAGLLAVAVASAAHAQKKYDPGATDTEIKIGNIMPYSGPASAYATIGKTEAAYFNKLNSEGGINGRKINFVSYDDGYSPPKAVEQARKLVEADEVLLIFNPLGTPSNSAIQKYMNAKKVPQIFVSSGAAKWNDPKNFPWTIGWQPSYQVEARIYAAYILKNYPGKTIGVLYQNDDFGKDYVIGLHEGLGDQAGRRRPTKPHRRQWIRRWCRSRAPTPTFSSTSRRRNSPHRRSRRFPKWPGTRCSSSPTCRLRSAAS